MDDGILQPSSNPLHFSHIDVLDWVTVLIEPNRSSRRISEFGFAKGPCEPLGILGFSADRFEGALQLKPSHVGALRIVRGNLLEPPLVGLGELSISWSCQSRGIVKRCDDAEGLIAHRS